jgi:hypothetical protein
MCARLGTPTGGVEVGWVSLVVFRGFGGSMGWKGGSRVVEGEEGRAYRCSSVPRGRCNSDCLGFGRGLRRRFLGLWGDFVRGAWM